MPDEILTATISSDYARQRLDVALAEMFPDYSRSRIQQWIKSGKVLLNGEVPKGKAKLLGDEKVEIHVQAEPLDDHCYAQDIPIDVIHQDEDVIIINKPVGMVVHPAAGHRDGTLQNALLHFDEHLNEVPRAGIVHRLDKDTSGLLVVARNLKAHKNLVAQLQARTVHREYQAIVLGVMTSGGTVNEPIGRHARDRKRMGVRMDAKEAITHYRVSERYRGHTRVKVNLETGRTHQIRVHMNHINFPIIGDPVYGGRLILPRGASDELKDALKSFKRQALHAAQLGLLHPSSGEEVHWKAPMAEDMKSIIDILRADMEESMADYDGFYDQ
jgi:23S rRNA pseudouridine1911/1915/1917 synthase